MNIEESGIETGFSNTPVDIETEKNMDFLIQVGIDNFSQKQV